jgi:hypothetical protein
MIDKAAVIIPDFESSVSKKILSVFQGKASLSTTIKGATTTTIATTTTTTLAALAATTTAPKSSSGTGTAKSSTTTTTTVPKVVIDQSTRGVVPPNDPNCQY